MSCLREDDLRPGDHPLITRPRGRAALAASIDETGLGSIVRTV
jgi:hypothetical protein